MRITSGVSHAYCLAAFASWAICLFAALNGCTTRPPESCSRQDIQLNWANAVALEQTVRVLSSAEFEGRKTQSQGAAKSRDYLDQQFKHLGLTPWGERFEIPFEYQTLFTRAYVFSAVPLGLCCHRALALRHRLPQTSD